MIGAKAFGSLLALAAGAFAAWWLGVFRHEHLARADARSAFVVGVIAVLVGTFVFRFLRLGEPSVHYFRWARELWGDEAPFVGTPRRSVAIGTNRGDAYDLSARAQLSLCIAGAFLLGLGTLDARAYRKLAAWPGTVFSAGSDYCPDPNREEAVEAAPEEPGCALIRRAYELGYAKSLGECAKSKRRAKSEPASVCHLRQIDEPGLHYASRRLNRFFSRVRAEVSPERLAESRQELDERLDRLDLLYASQRQVIANTPRASHHVFTNLPDPGNGAFDPITCADRYRELPHRTPEDSASIAFEHVLGQLLFDTRYEAPAGYCREYRVHWAQSDDVCSALSADPAAVLEKNGALGEIRAALDRQRIATELFAADPEGMHTQSFRELEPATFISFQCWIEGAPKRSRAKHSFTLDGRPLTAEERRVPAQGAVGRHLEVAKLLAPHFNYGALHSEAGVETSVSGAATLKAFNERDFRLSRLQTLSSVDVFLDARGIAERRELLEVYPYHVHLRNYVQLFRREYRLNRGRL